MLTRRHFVSLAALAFATAVPAAAAPYTDAAFQAAKAAGKPIVIAFHADWCPTCRAQAPVLKSLLSSEYGGFTYLVVNFDGQKNVLKKFRVRQQSTLIVYKSGAEVARAVGVTDKGDISQLLSLAN